MGLGGSELLVLGTIIASVFAYFLPWLVARHRKHEQVGAILILNLLLGWTVIGWGVAMVWAVTTRTSVPVAVTNVVATTPVISPAGYCSKCGTPRIEQAKFCQACGTAFS